MNIIEFQKELSNIIIEYHNNYNSYSKVYLNNDAQNNEQLDLLKKCLDNCSTSHGRPHLEYILMIIKKLKEFILDIESYNDEKKSILKVDLKEFINTLFELAINKKEQNVIINNTTFNLSPFIHQSMVNSFFYGNKNGLLGDLVVKLFRKIANSESVASDHLEIILINISNSVDQYVPSQNYTNNMEESFEILRNPKQTKPIFQDKSTQLNLAPSLRLWRQILYNDIFPLSMFHNLRSDGKLRLINTEDNESHVESNYKSTK